MPSQTDLPLSSHHKRVVTLLRVTKGQVIVVLDSVFHAGAILHLREEVVAQHALGEWFVELRQHREPLSQESLQLLIVRTSDQVEMLRTILSSQLFVRPIILVDEKEELPTLYRATLPVALSCSPVELVFDPHMVDRVPVGTSPQGLRKFGVKTVILVTRLFQGSKCLKWHRRSTNPIPCLISTT